MTDHPSPFSQSDDSPIGIDWDDRASLHRKNDGQGLFDALKGHQRGTLAEMIKLVLQMPEETRGEYVIEKAGDHRLDTAEIMALASRPDFPR